jgi:hypothetical protein
MILCASKETLVRVPAIVFDYPRHSGATDEGMTNRSSIFAYLVFGPGEVAIERTARLIRAMIRCGPGALLGMQARTRGVQSVLVFG